jgi:hypothetical protein
VLETNIERGVSIPTVCQLESISYRNFRRRVAASPRLQERLKEAETVRFNLRHEEAIQIIMESAQRSLMAAGWCLERNIPARHALRPVPRDSHDEQPVEEEIPAEALARHRALLLELAREDEARANVTQGESVG